MAFRLEKCFCCSLEVAASVISIYTLIAYIIALLMEILWITQAKADLLACSYLLCGVYFLLLVMTGCLLCGLSLRKTIYLLEWLIVIAIFSFPEAILVFMVNNYYRNMHSLYGLTEITCWMCRVVVNIAGIVCIQSLYQKWKEEKHVLRSLQDLHMKSLERRRRASVVDGMNGDGGGAAHQNTRYSDSVSVAGVGTPSDWLVSPRDPKLKRSVSSLSNSNKTYPVLSRINSVQYRKGSLPLEISSSHGVLQHQQHPSVRPASPFVTKQPLFSERQFIPSMSEFNASHLDLALARVIHNNNDHSYPGAGPSPLYRTRSMFSLRGGYSDNDYPSKKHPAMGLRKAVSLVSLDRGGSSNRRRPVAIVSPVDVVDSKSSKRRHSFAEDRFNITARRLHIPIAVPTAQNYYVIGNSHNYFPDQVYDASSRNARFSPSLTPVPADYGRSLDTIFYTGQRLHAYKDNYPPLYPAVGSMAKRKISVGNGSDDFQKYRDVAL